MGGSLPVSGSRTVARSDLLSLRLWRRVRFVNGPLMEASERFVSHPRAAEIYPEYLICLLAIMRGIGAVMDIALTRANASSDTDPVALGLAPYLERHIAEEQGHDAWVLEDLEELGADTSGLARRILSPAVAELIGAQYYWVLHAHPVAVLGYLAVAEGGPSMAPMVKRLQVATRQADSAFRTLLEHAELDPSHGDEVYSVIDALPLSAEQEQLIIVSAMSTAGLMSRALEEVLETAPLLDAHTERSASH